MPLRILAWPRDSPSNVYTGSLNAALERQDGVHVFALSYNKRAFASAVRARIDIIHMHWFERAFWAPDTRTFLRQVGYVVATTLALKARGARLVWTAHDPAPHQSPLNHRLFNGWTRLVWRAYHRLMLTMIDGVLLLSESHRQPIVDAIPRLGRVPMAVTPHPHYRGRYPDDVDKRTARARLGIPADIPVLAFVGSLRAYKNPIGLMEAFTAYAGDALLVIAGATETAEEAAMLEARAATDARIRLHDAFVSDDDLQYWLRAADLSVLPYQRVTNSGSAHLALSFDLPVLVPDEPVFRELEALVGDGWVRRFAGELSSDHLRNAIAWVRQPREPSPDLSSLDWDKIAEGTIRFYRQLGGQRSSTGREAAVRAGAVAVSMETKPALIDGAQTGLDCEDRDR